jgi:hypothetical protein
LPTAQRVGFLFLTAPAAALSLSHALRSISNQPIDPEQDSHVPALPEVVTHRYDPAGGMGLNLCSLADDEAEAILDRLRREPRPTLKPGYLARRRKTEEWLKDAASAALGRRCHEPPVYFFLGDFSYCADRSRPASLVIPLAAVPPDCMTFTLGDSMTVSSEPSCRVCRLEEMVALFADGGTISGFGLTDKTGFQKRFIEMQLWDSSVIPLTACPGSDAASAL